MINTNVVGLIRLTQIFVREMKKQDSGVSQPAMSSQKRPSPADGPQMIINLGSIAGREPYAGGGIYCATKAAVRSFNGSLLRELVNTNIRVCEIQPGMFCVLHPG
jgi:3-hydroxy acid dehydrogenase/malonic semialdehyde reductase